MKLVHLSDLHLGFRAYGRSERGMNVRERDVMAAFDRAVQAVIELRPHAVVISGDIFDRPDPPAGAVVAVARALESLRRELPESPVLMVAGPRDTPRRPGDPGALAVLDTYPNVEAATGLARTILVERLELNAVLLPYRALMREGLPPPEPDPDARWNLLVLHGRVGAGSGPGVFVDPTEWSYVALGGEHGRREVAPMVHVAGSLERVALDPWAYAGDEKGFLSVDLETGETRFHPIPGRPVVALAPVKVVGEDPERLRRRVHEVVSEVPGGISGKIVRLRLEGAEPRDLLALQGEELRALRRRALHLAVEAGSEPADPGAPESGDAAREALVRVLERELARDGVAEAEAADLVQALLASDPYGPGAEAAVGDLDALDGELSGAGRLSTSVVPGLTAFIGGQGRSRRALTGLIQEAGLSGTSQQSPLAELWSGRDGGTLEGAVRCAAAALAAQRGLTLVEAALRRAHALAGDEPPPADDGWAAPDLEDGVAGDDRDDPDGAGALLRELESAEKELRGLRADAAEVTGDLQVAVMDWHRERQDAETTLNAYRDRARELRTRIRALRAAGPSAPCPTCGRVLEGHLEEVLEELGAEWEAVVQDGRWWRSRWEQLELKPAHLQELESRSLRVHAALEAAAERVELLRARIRDVGSGPPDAGDGAQPARRAAVVLRRLRRARLARARERVLARASRYVCRISGGRILAVTWEGDGPRLEGDGGPLPAPSPEDLAAGRVAVRLAGAALVTGVGGPLRSLLLEEPFDQLDEEARVRTLVLMRRLLRRLPRVLLVSRGEAVDATPELFDAILEIRDDPGSGGGALVPAPSGSGRVMLKSDPALLARRRELQPSTRDSRRRG